MMNRTRARLAKKETDMYRIAGPMVALFVVTALTACAERGGEGPAQVGAGALGGFERAERGCVARAEARGLMVEGVQFTQSRMARGGRITGAETVLVVSSGGRTYPLRCQFTYGSGVARLSSD